MENFGVDRPVVVVEAAVCGYFIELKYDFPLLHFYSPVDIPSVPLPLHCTLTLW